VRAAHVAWAVTGLCVVLTVVDTMLVTASYPALSTKSFGIHGWPWSTSPAGGAQHWVR